VPRIKEIMFVLCLCCNRHLRQDSASCPFCGESTTNARPVGHARAVGRSRSALLLGVAGVTASLLGASCSDRDGDEPRDGGVMSVVDAYGVPPDGGPMSSADAYGAPPGDAGRDALGEARDADAAPAVDADGTASDGGRD
jgi:hypothetical protein